MEKERESGLTGSKKKVRQKVKAQHGQVWKREGEATTKKVSEKDRVLSGGARATA